jgi:hypothetical protein
MRKYAGLFVLSLAFVSSGCSESALIRSYPPGAKLYVNDQFIGLTPTVYSTKHSNIGDVHRVHFVRDGYEASEGNLRTRICPGRIVGGVFTLGIVLLIRGPTCFVSPQDFPLEPLPRGAAAGSSTDPTVEERLQRIERMRNDGRINQQEYEEYRKQILKEL